MEPINNQFSELLAAIQCTETPVIEKLPQSGGDRIYYRLHTSTFALDGKHSFIVTVNEHLKENQSFLRFTEHFRKAGVPVPQIYAVTQAGDAYIQQDLGQESLLQVLEAEGKSDRVYRLFQQSLQALAALQIRGDRGFDYTQCLTSREFGQQAILSDLLYFKYYFLDPLKVAYDKESLLQEFETLSRYLAHTDYRYFMFRDFQSRNIMVYNDQPWFIDYQGGMKGALPYDVASLLWQAKAELPEDWKKSLLNHYMDCVEAELQQPIDRQAFSGQYQGYVLIRLLQVLGAYGFRGLFERKAHFLTSIPLALRNLQSYLQNHWPGLSLPLLESLLNRLVQDDIIQRFETVRASKDTPLIVHINSFSFIKRGYPAEDNGNGGGYVFDCRGLHNPGRYEPYKQLTGRDKPVKEFLEQQSRVEEFLAHVYQVVDISVEDYIQRGFEHLTVNFGCTGGQHRSVYCADALARHLRNKFGVKIELNHLEQGIHEVKS